MVGIVWFNKLYGTVPKGVRGGFPYIDIDLQWKTQRVPIDQFPPFFIFANVAQFGRAVDL